MRLVGFKSFTASINGILSCIYSHRSTIGSQLHLLFRRQPIHIEIGNTLNTILCIRRKWDSLFQKSFSCMHSNVLPRISSGLALTMTPIRWTTQRNSIGEIHPTVSYESIFKLSQQNLNYNIGNILLRTNIVIVGSRVNPLQPQCGSTVFNPQSPGANRDPGQMKLSLGVNIVVVNSLKFKGSNCFMGGLPP